MKVLDFLNEAWLRGTYSESAQSCYTLRNLQEFATNPNAEVFACASGLLVLDLHDVERPTLSKRGANLPEKKGQLYHVDQNQIIPLTSEEDRETLLRLTRAFIASPNYWQADKGIDRFKQHYQNGVFNQNPDEPNQ